jgi:hypothetical protein
MELRSRPTSTSSISCSRTGRIRTMPRTCRHIGHRFLASSRTAFCATPRVAATLTISSISMVGPSAAVAIWATRVGGHRSVSWNLRSSAWHRPSSITLVKSTIHWGSSTPRGSLDSLGVDEDFVLTPDQYQCLIGNPGQRSTDRAARSYRCSVRLRGQARQTGQQNAAVAIRPSGQRLPIEFNHELGRSVPRAVHSPEAAATGDFPPRAALDARATRHPPTPLHRLA